MIPEYELCDPILRNTQAGLKGKLDVLGNLNLNQDTNGHVSV